MNIIANNDAPFTGAALHGTEPPSDWVKRWSHLVAPNGRVLDVACGYGRHAWWFYKLNHHVTLVDRAQAAIESIAIPPDACEKLVADIENNPWPLPGRLFDAVVVTNYLWRPILADLVACLAPGGVLIYETFAAGNETVGKPARADFLLRCGELLEICSQLRIVAFEEGFLTNTPGTNLEKPRFIQRIAAVHEVQALPLPHAPNRYLLA